MRLAALCASSALLVSCGASAGAGRAGGLVEPHELASMGPTARTVSYRTDSFTDPTFDISPDGQRLYFAAMGEIYVVPIAGGFAEPLPLGPGWKTRPAISPDGLSMGFLSDRGAGVAAWRSPLSAEHPATGQAVPGHEATTLAWVDDDTLVSAGGNTEGAVGLGLTVDYEGEHGHARLDGHDRGSSGSDWTRPASMSADHQGNVFLHRYGRIVRIDASTGIEEVAVPIEDFSTSQPRVTPDGDWLGFASMSGGAAHLMLKNLASGAVRATGCRLNPWGAMPQAAPGPEPSYAFIPGEPAVILERDGRFRRCTFEGVETPVPVQAAVRIDLAPRVRPSRLLERSAPGIPLDVASTADGRTVAFSRAGDLWLHSPASGQTRRISNAGALERNPAFSPDGGHIAYVERLQDESSNLKMLDLASGASTVLLHSQDVLTSLAWSPDGRRIAFIQMPVTGRSESTLRWLGVDGSSGVVGPITTDSLHPVPSLAWDGSGSALLYTQAQALVSHPLDGEPRPLLSADPRVWDILVSPSRRFVALGVRDGVYITPIVLSSGDRPSFSWSDVRSMRRVWIGAADHLQWLADDSLIWTAQNRLMRAWPGEEPREVANLALLPERSTEPERRAYTGATVISVDRAGTIDDAVIVTRGRTLEYVGPRAGAPDLTGLETTDLSGRWIVPGFVDVHAHNHSTELSEYNLPVSQFNLAEVAFGVTTAFDPSETSVVESAAHWADSQEDEFIGPTIYGVGFAVLGGVPGNTRSTKVESLAHALVLASDTAGRGGLMLKDYLQGSRQQRQWLAQAARATGLGVTAHESPTPSITLPLIVDGYTAVEHAVAFGPLHEDIKRFLIESQVGLTPTLAAGGVMSGNIAEPASPDLRRDCLVNPALMAIPASRPDGQHGAGIGVYANDYADLLNRGARVTIGGHGEAPGLDFHWELALLATGGATPMNLLQAATLNGAEKLGLEGRIGSLVEGKDADFVVLNANPLDDIRNARNIERVVRRGRTVTWPAGPAPQSWTSTTSWDECQNWNFGLGRSAAAIPN